MKPSTYRVLMAIAFVLLAARHIFAQTPGDIATFKKASGPGDVKTYTTPVNTSLYSLNGSGNFSLLPQSTFQGALISGTNIRTVQGTSLLGSGNINIIDDAINNGVTVAGPSQNAVFDALTGKADASHTHVSADITDASTGGNGALDGGKVAIYGAAGQLWGSSDTGLPAIYGTTIGSAYAGFFSGGGVTNETLKAIGSGSVATFAAVSSTGYAVDAQSGSGVPLHIHSLNTLGSNPNLAEFNKGLIPALQVAIKHDGGLEWSSATGAQTTATNLPAFGSSTKGVVPASGGGTSNFLRADGTWTAPTASAAWGSITGTLSSQTDLNSALSGKEPTITAGTTGQYWRGDKSWQTLDKSAVGLGSVENTALSTWTGSSSIATVGTVGSGKWQGDAVGVAYGGTGATSLTGIVKGNGTSAFTAAVAGTDYLEPTGSGSGLTALPSNTALYPTLNQNTTGSAATLTTARTIQTDLASTSSASFNGSANITPGVTGTLPITNGGTGATNRAAAEEAITRTTESTALASDFTTTSTSAVDVTGLSVSVAANSTYRYEVWCEWASSSTSGTLAPNLSAPSGATVTGYRQATLAAGTVTNGAIGVATAAAGTANSRQFMVMHGICITSGTSGTLQVTLASGNASHTARIYAGATIRATKVQ